MIYRVVGSIYLASEEIEADNEEEATEEFKKIHTYQHDSGMTVSPTVKEVEEVCNENQD